MASRKEDKPVYDEANIAELRGVVARGWCHPKNAHKVMDCDLAEAIVQEIVQWAADGTQGTGEPSR